MDEARSHPIDSEERIATYDGPDRMVHFTDFKKERDKRGSFAIKVYSDRYPQLDSLLDGFETGELVTITGPTGSGKTLLAETLGLSFMNQGLNVGWFSYEVPTGTMIDKYKDGTSLGLYVPLELKAGDFKWLIDRSLEAKLKHGCRAIIIDHLHFLVDMDMKLNMSLNIGAVVRHIKREIAIEMNMIVFLIAHQTQSNDEREPGLNHIRDSSFVGQESDTVLTVYRQVDVGPNGEKMGISYDQGYATVKVDKARRTGTFRKKLTFQKRGQFLAEF